MNTQAVQILFLKDLFLSRWPLFGYFIGGLASAGIACLPGETFGFIGFILMVTVTIASGIHLIGTLLLAESIDHTRTFIMTLPVSLLDYSLAKIAVMITTFLIPWTTMLALLTIATFVAPEGKPGALAFLALMFLFMLATFAVQLVTAVVTESVGWTICVLVFCNVLLNLFLKSVREHAVISELITSDSLHWPPVVLWILAGELAVVGVAIGGALYMQTRRRDLA